MNDATLTDRIQQVIAAEIRPGLQATGGDIELVGLDGRIAMVRLHGSCRACPSTAMTLVMGIERQLRERVPEIEYVEVTG